MLEGNTAVLFIGGNKTTEGTTSCLYQKDHTVCTQEGIGVGIRYWNLGPRFKAGNRTVVNDATINSQEVSKTAAKLLTVIDRGNRLSHGGSHGGSDRGGRRSNGGGGRGVACKNKKHKVPSARILR